MWIAVGAAVGMGLVVLCLAVKYRMLKNCIRQAGQDLAEIMDNPGENRILLTAAPSREGEELLLQINRYIEYHQQERIIWQQQERQLQDQIENISHDLRTPLTSILGYLELMDDGSLSGGDREALAVVERKSRYLQGLISDFYDLSRLEQADMCLRLESVEITRLIRETVLSYYPEFEERHLAVELTLPETAVMLKGEQKAMERILHNMLQNALRYARSCFRIRLCHTDVADGQDSEPGGGRQETRDRRKVREGQSAEGRREIQTGGIAEKNRIYLDFSNDAENLTQTDIPYLFDRFYTADHARPGGSTGLGLTISKLLAEAMGGTVTAQLTERKELHLIFEFEPAGG
ncbi:MAG: HAMP domain-containing histidine kinase [Acetatifactor sp.]|nr:HAMP domain-containing histidine kinase [Acetatifactor sp.]